MRERCINDVIRRQMVGGWHPGIDEMQKSEIEKRKRNMESISRISRREKRNVEICFLVREENENFFFKILTIENIEK